MVFCTALTVLTLIGLRRLWRFHPSVAVPYSIVFFFFPMIYYFTHPEDYYRRPIDPECVVLAVCAATSWASERKGQLTASRANATA
jgi:energy-coupling factor transporter transmembrane protein EcfT